MEINKVYCMDALEFLKQLPDKYADLILTDPPYGIKADRMTNFQGYGMADTRKYEDRWDTKPPEKEIFIELLRVGKKIIIFGGNFFTDKLPVGSHWIVWDKKGDIKFKNMQGDCELAWTNINLKSIKKYIIIQQGFVAEEKARLHPTQKPVVLFEAIIKDYTEPEQIVIDPFIGSGTTAIACKRSNRNFMGCDIEQKYIDITKKRLENSWT